MILPINWLKQIVPNSDSAEKIAEIFTSIGQEVEEVKDGILKFEITPNRGDCLSILGLAREYAAVTNRKLQLIKPNISQVSSQTKLNITFADKNLCPRYTYCMVENFQIKPSPKWLQDRLMHYGFRPINNLVDITNYVMIELGQPMHAFDLQKISGDSLKIRLSKKGESLITLDGKEHKLDSGMIIIEDKKKIIDLAGIMGGYNSEVDKNTNRILLQAAIFDPILIRMTAKSLKHTTDASYRYERGVDWQNTLLGLNRALELLLESCPRAKIGLVVDFQNQIPKPKLIDLDLQRINRFLSTDLSEKQILMILTRLGFTKKGKQIQVPSWRNSDIYGWQDLVEEIGRIYGYNKLKALALPQKIVAKQEENYLLIEKTKDLLIQEDYSEIIGYPFISKQELDIFDCKTSEVPKIIKPISLENEFLRPSLLASLLRAVAKNPWYPEIKIFEIGKVFYQNQEKYQIGILETTNKEKNLLSSLQNLEKSLENKFKFQIFKPEAEILAFYKIKRPVVLALLDSPVSTKKIIWQELKSGTKRFKYLPISEFHPTFRDLAFIVDQDLDSQKILEVINSLKFSQARIGFGEKFDEFVSAKFGENKKSLAFHILLDPKKKLGEKEINSIFEQIIATIEETFQAKLRDF